MLCYHTFDSPKITPYTVDSRKFYEQMRFLAVQHIPVISLAQLSESLEKGTPLPERSVVITIDDGYKTARTIAWPILKKFGFPFTVFVYPQAISRHGSAMTWDDLRTMAREGVDVESHSYTHPLLTHPGHAMTKADYRAWLDHELVDSKRELEKQLRRPVTALAYPFGGYDELIVERARMAGYKTASTCDEGPVTPLTDPMHLNRCLVFHRASPRRFQRYFSSKPLVMGELSPRDGERLKKPPINLEARILNVKDIQPESTQIIVDKLGGHFFPVRVDPASGRFQVPLPKEPKRGYYFVSLMAKDRTIPSLWREASWLFIIRSNASKK